MPAANNAAPARSCAECGSLFVPGRETARFCAEACRKAWGNRNTGRGGSVVPILQAWGMTRHAKPGTREAEINRYARRELTDMARTLNGEDKAAGRASVLDYVGALMDARVMFVDRKRS